MAEYKNWIQVALKRPGAFTKKAEEAGKTTEEYSADVSKNPEKYDKRTVRQARLARILSKLRKRKKAKQKAN
jgi:hypothetical protein